MKTDILKPMNTIRLILAFAVAALCVPLAPPAYAADPAQAPLAPTGYKIVTGTTLVTAKFQAFMPLESTVIDTITFPATTAKGTYNGDAAINGKTVAANVVYPVWGKTIKLTSGSVLLILRP